MRALRHGALLSAIILLSLSLAIAGPKKPYENVSREILIEPYWKDSQPASNILRGARSHERGPDSRFEAKGFTRFTPAEFAAALMASDMKVLALLREHSKFERDGTAYDLDLDMLRRYVVALEANPDATDTLIFKAGYIVFAIAGDDGYTDIILPIESAAAAPLIEAVKKTK